MMVQIDACVHTSITNIGKLHDFTQQANKTQTPAVHIRLQNIYLGSTHFLITTQYNKMTLHSQ